MGRTKGTNSKTKHWCVVPGCKSDSRKSNNIEKYPWMQYVTFRSFPTAKRQPRLCAQWIAMIRRLSDYNPKPWHRICSKHFRQDGKSDIPELFPWNNYKESRNLRSTTAIQKREAWQTTTGEQDYSAVPAQIEDLVDFESAVCDCDELEDIEVFPNDELPYVVCEMDITTSFVENPQCKSMEDHSYLSSDYSSSPVTHKDSSTQTDLTLEDVTHLEQEVRFLSNKFEDKDTLLRDCFTEKITENDESIRKYTGIPNLEIFNELNNICEDYEPNLKYWTDNSSVDDKKYQNTGGKPGPKRKLTRRHEFLMTMLRLRLALPTFLLAALFGVSNSRVSSIFTTWIFYLYHIFKDMIVWPSRNLVRKHMPFSFKKSFPKTRCIIDCSEIFIQRPRDPSIQAKTYSTYKSHNTYKFLISITPSGLINFVSQIWGGNTSDRFITMNSGFLDLVSPGDEVMADRGFTIRDLLTERHAYLNIPPFTRKCSWGKGKRLNASEIRRTRLIANLRIHVERAIQRLKTFKMISQVIPWNMKSVVNPMVVVAAFICNLMKPLVKK